MDKLLLKNPVFLYEFIRKAEWKHWLYKYANDENLHNLSEPKIAKTFTNSVAVAIYFIFAYSCFTDVGHTDFGQSHQRITQITMLDAQKPHTYFRLPVNGSRKWSLRAANNMQTIESSETEFSCKNPISMFASDLRVWF